MYLRRVASECLFGSGATFFAGWLAVHGRLEIIMLHKFCQYLWALDVLARPENLALNATGAAPLWVLQKESGPLCEQGHSHLSCKSA
eukprot:3679556-Amphidinium_carterae.2